MKLTLQKHFFPALLSSTLIAFSFNAITSEKNSDDNVWITIGTDAVELINQKSQPSFSFNSTQLNNMSNGEVAIVSIAQDQLESLNHFMHDNFNRCGGFVFHESFAQAQEYINTSKNIASSILVDYTIDNPDGVNTLLGALNASNLSTTVNTLSSYNNRYYNSQTGEEAANWISSHWSSIGSSRSDINVELYDHSWRQPSVIATVTGTTKPNEVIIIGGHLDSINSFSPSNGRAPGSDDNASGIAIATEVLRAIVATGFKPERTIKFMGYAAEEVGLRGSKAIAQDFKSSGVNVVGVAQFDMSGYKGSNVDIVFITDYTNSAQTTFMTQLLDTYLPSISYGFDQCGYACSDHASWHNQGYPASMPFEAYMNQYNNSIHSSGDSSYDQNHAFNFVKLSATYVAELAKGGTGDTPPPPADTPLLNGVPITGISGSAKEQNFYLMDVPSEANNLSFNTSGGSGDADLYVKYGSKPSLQVYDCKSTSSGSNETCTISPHQTGDYFVMVEAWNAISNITLEGNYSTANDSNALENGVPKTGLSASTGNDIIYTMDAPSGSNNINFQMSGGTGDADLYIKFGSNPTDTDYDCRPYLSGNNETCAGTASDGTYYIRVKAYETFSNVNLTGSYSL